MCSFNFLVVLLKDWGFAAVIFTAILILLITKINRRKEFRNVLRLLRDEVRDLDVTKYEFNPEPKNMMHLNPILIVSKNLLLSNYYDEIKKEKMFYDLLWNFHVSVENSNGFLKTYNDVIWRESENVEKKRKMFENMENFQKNVRNDREFLLAALLIMFKKLKIE